MRAYVCMLSCGVRHTCVRWRACFCVWLYLIHDLVVFSKYRIRITVEPKHKHCHLCQYKNQTKCITYCVTYCDYLANDIIEALKFVSNIQVWMNLLPQRIYCLQQMKNAFRYLFNSFNPEYSQKMMLSREY